MATIKRGTIGQPEAMMLFGNIILNEETWEWNSHVLKSLYEEQGKPDLLEFMCKVSDNLSREYGVLILNYGFGDTAYGYHIFYLAGENTRDYDGGIYAEIDAEDMAIDADNLSRFTLAMGAIGLNTSPRWILAVNYDKDVEA